MIWVGTYVSSIRGRIELGLSFLFVYGDCGRSLKEGRRRRMRSSIGCAMAIAGILLLWSL